MSHNASSVESGSRLSIKRKISWYRPSSTHLRPDIQIESAVRLSMEVITLPSHQYPRSYSSNKRHHRPNCGSRILFFHPVFFTENSDRSLSMLSLLESELVEELELRIRSCSSARISSSRTSASEDVRGSSGSRCS